MSNAAIISITIDKSQQGSLVLQLYDALLTRINDRLFQPGFRMPSSRQFALELGVSRSTVVSAFDQLVAEGFLEPRKGSGLYVLDVGEIPYLPGGTSNARRNETYVKDRQSVEERPLPFSNGVPDMRLFPYKSWARQVSRVARQMPWAFVENETGFGDYSLRYELAKHLLEWRGIPASPDQIVITAGARDAVELILKTIAGKQDAIAIEDPGYLPLQTIAESTGAETIYLAIDSHGAIPPTESENQPAPIATVLTPSFQFPLGATMPTGRKNSFLELAERHGSWIIEDDFDSEFRYSGQPVTAMASRDGLNRVVYIGSFSKIFSSGLRIGFLVAPVALLDAVRHTQAKFGSRASSAPQRALAGFLENGEFHRHLRKMKRIYGARRASFIGRLKSELGAHISFLDNPAGMQLAVYFKKPVDDLALARQALKQGLSCAPLSRYYRKFPSKRGLVLGFCSHGEAEFEKPMQDLGELVHRSISY